MVFILSISVLLLSYTNYLVWLRIVFGHLFVFLFAGWPTSKHLFPKQQLLDRILSSSLISLLLTYPSTVIVAVLEGQTGQAIFSKHLPTSISVLFLLSQICFFVFKKFWKPTPIKLKKVPIGMGLIISLLIYSTLVSYNLNRADFVRDEYDMAHQAYNLVDGILAGRKAYLISYGIHPPLTSAIKHFSLNLLQPNGLDYLQDWHPRFSEGIIGILVIIASYTFAFRISQNRKIASITALLLATNPYMVFMGRIYHRDLVLTLFMLLTLYYLSYKKLHSKNSLLLTAASLGASLLTKETSILLIPIFVLSGRKITWILKTLLLSLVFFIPVLLFNLMAYLSTGYMDLFFSAIFGIDRPLVTTVASTGFGFNLRALFTYLWDLYSPPLMVLFCLSLILSFKNLNSTKIRLLIAFISLSVIFFAKTALRGYYFIFITPPLTILLSYQLKTLTHRRLLTPVLVILTLYLCFYSYNSVIASRPTNSASILTYDEQVIIPHPLTQNYSSVARDWTLNYGYKNLIATLDQLISQDSCVEVDPLMNDLAVRRYFWVNDKLKQHYLTNYQSRFPKCHNQTQHYFVSDQMYSFNLLKTIEGEYPLIKFYIYQK